MHPGASQLQQRTGERLVGESVHGDVKPPCPGRPTQPSRGEGLQIGGRCKKRYGTPRGDRAAREQQASCESYFRAQRGNRPYAPPCPSCSASCQWAASRAGAGRPGRFTPAQAGPREGASARFPRATHPSAGGFRANLRMRIRSSGGGTPPRPSSRRRPFRHDLAGGTCRSRAGSCHARR